MQIGERDCAARLYGGTGLGPPISKGLIEAHHGQLVIDSSPGRGTRVRVIRPPHRCRSARRNRAPRGRRATIAPSPDRGPARSAADPSRPFSRHIWDDSSWPQTGRPLTNAVRDDLIGLGASSPVPYAALSSDKRFSVARSISFAPVRSSREISAANASIEAKSLSLLTISLFK